MRYCVSFLVSDIHFDIINFTGEMFVSRSNVFTEMSLEFASQLVDIIFRTLLLYDDLASRKAVDDAIVKALDQLNFIKSFAATLVQTMEKQLKFDSHIGCLKLLKWSCLLVSNSQFISVSKNALWRLVNSQASLLQISFQGSFRIRRACRKVFVRFFSQVIFLNLSFML